MSLVHIFTAIGTRLGLDVSPINFPGTVLAYVQPLTSGEQPIVVNPSSHAPAEIVAELQNANPVPQTHLHFPMGNLHSRLIPCDGASMLMRASRNVLGALMNGHEATRSTAYPALLLTFCVNILFQMDDNSLSRFFQNIHVQPLDCIFLLKDLSPALLPRCQTLLKAHCHTVLKEEAIGGAVQHHRDNNSVKFFVGMPFIHAKYQYVGFICGWDVSDFMSHRSNLAYGSCALVIITSTGKL